MIIFDAKEKSRVIKELVSQDMSLAWDDRDTIEDWIEKGHKGYYNYTEEELIKEYREICDQAYEAKRLITEDERQKLIDELSEKEWDVNYGSYESGKEIMASGIKGFNEHSDEELVDMYKQAIEELEEDKIPESLRHLIKE